MLLDKKLPEKNIQIATFLAFCLVPLSGIATDIFIPSLPKMVTELREPESRIRLTISLFLVSYGISQFVSGALIDAWGRYRLNIYALLAFTVCSLMIVFTNSLTVILVARVVQGICAGTIAASKRTMIVDIYKDEKLRHYLSIITIVWSIGPIIAPFLGGWLDTLFGWRSCFVFLGAYSAIVLVLELVFSGETLRQANSFRPGALLLQFRTMLADKNFFYGIFILGCCYGMVILFGLVSSFIIEDKMGLSTVTAGYVALVMGLAWMLGGFIGKQTISRSFFPKIKLANLFQIVFSLLMIGSAAVWGGLWSLVFFAFLIHVGAGFIFNNYFAFCLARFPRMAGLSGGLTGGLSYIFCSFFSYAVVHAVNPQGQKDLGIAYLVFSLVIAVVLYFIIKPRKSQV